MTGQKGTCPVSFVARRRRQAVCGAGAELGAEPHAVQVPGETGSGTRPRPDADVTVSARRGDGHKQRG